MGKSYKIDKDTFELSSKMKRKGNSRKVIASNKIQERRRQRQKEKEMYGRYYRSEQDLE